MSSDFDPAIVPELRDARTIRLETARGPDQPSRVTVIWSVIDDAGRLLVRSVRGERGRWYRDLRANPIGAVLLPSGRLAVRAELADDAERIAACTRALTRKYGGQGASLASMVTDEVLATTLELFPA